VNTAVPSRAAQPAHAADRCAREIIGILTAIMVRLRRLMGTPFGGIVGMEGGRVA
jgi:hypothetical protein